ncbi:MAG: hypothetical protein NC421_02120 [Lachnospiraceae bacterium]|nr:hypothetical protein [Lachnospiraceae bacterium]
MRFILAILSLCFASPALPIESRTPTTHITIDVPDSIATKSTTVSVSVTDGGLPAENSTTIGCEILLNSELKGNIETPQYYFENPDAGTDIDLDLLMMTQGWRRYDCTDILNDSLPKIDFPVEQSQSISGHVEKSFNRHPKGMKVVLFSPTTLEMTQFQLGDSNRFVISGLDFVDGTPFTLEAQTKDGGTSTVSIHIDSVAAPKVSPLMEYASNSQQADSTTLSFSQYVKKQPRTPSLLDMQELDEVSVTARKKQKWSSRGNINPHRSYKDGDEKIARFSTMESLLRSLSVRIRHSDNDGGALPEPQFGEYVTNDFIPTPVFIDGFRSEQREAFDLHPQNVNSIEYFRPGDARVASYTPEAIYTGVLLITTKYGSEGKRTQQPSMASITPLGYQPPVEFYVPKYPEAEDALYHYPGSRPTLYWNPKLSTGANGKFSIEIPESTCPKLNISLQGITHGGKIIDITKAMQSK